MDTDKLITALNGCMCSMDCRKCPILGQCNGTFDFALHVTAEHIKAQDAQLAAKDYTILGIMHAVDKWLDGDELKADEINRAATMREKTLQIVEKLTAQLAEKDRQLGAAVENIPHNCEYCASRRQGECCALLPDGDGCSPDYTEGFDRDDCQHWEWHGPQKAGEVEHGD